MVELSHGFTETPLSGKSHMVGFMSRLQSDVSAIICHISEHIAHQSALNQAGKYQIQLSYQTFTLMLYQPVLTQQLTSCFACTHSHPF